MYYLPAIQTSSKADKWETLEKQQQLRINKHPRRQHATEIQFAKNRLIDFDGVFVYARVREPFIGF